MPYPRKLLNPHEEVAVDLHPHWWYYAKPAALLVFAIIVGIGTIVFGPDGGTGRTMLNWLSIILIIVAVFWLIGRYAKWSTTNFVITSDRLIFREGVVAKRGVEIPLERVNTVHFNQSVFERIVGAGDLVIESGGEEGRQNFTDIRNPDRVQQTIHVQKEENDRRRFTIPERRGTDVASQLEKLEGMLERGTLTIEEVAAQKAKLLGDWPANAHRQPRAVEHRDTPRARRECHRMHALL
ncbi:MAG: PH domain-containing protein [Ilumatobacter sp.]